MDPMLSEAAWTGNLETLLKLIEDNPRILHSVSLFGGENPLHTACLAGHLNFVKEIIRLMPGFVNELDQDGCSPLHIASANGHLEIVKELIRVDRTKLCLVKAKERRIPLHYAVIKGRVEVIKELILTCVDSIGCLTARGESVLHLAVKNNQFEALQILVEYISEFRKEDVLNVKDDQGNTILHFAVSRKQLEVVEFLLNEQVIPNGKIDLNSTNNRGLTPLDVLLLFQSEAGDREIEEIVRQSGAKTTNEANRSTVQNQDTSTRPHPRSPSKQLLEYFKYDNTRDSPSKVRNTLLVITILIATATYQSVLSPPGSVWQDDINNDNNNNGLKIKKHKAGHAVMGTHNPIAYSLFVFFNSVGFFMSLHMINVLTSGFPMRLELQICMIALITTYDTSMSAIAPNTALTHFFTGISIAIPVLIPIITAGVRNCANRHFFTGMSIGQPVLIPIITAGVRNCANRRRRALTCPNIANV